MDFYEVGKKELCKHKCDPHSLTRTRTLKGGWFGLTRGYSVEGGRITMGKFEVTQTRNHRSRPPVGSCSDGVS